MKTSENRTTVSTNIQVAPSTFSIKATGAAFKVLSDSLYKDKIAAIIRELACNAIDSHKEANNPDPIEITLPNRLKPIFAVQDHGIGLSHDEVLQLYTTYFSSSKQDSNDLIGSFGLGSKSPFAYTDTFSVVSIKDGEKNTYSCVLDAKRFPQVMRISTSQTQAHNGLRVEFPVREEDTQEFVIKAAKIFQWLDSTPQIIGISKTIFENICKERTPTVDLKHPNWSIYTNRSDYSLVAVKMGQVLYPVSLQHSSISETFQNWRYQFGDHSSILIVFNANIGEVDIAPSREELDYTKKTVHFLKSASRNFFEEVLTVISAEAQSIASEFDRKGTIARRAKTYKVSSGKNLDTSNLEVFANCTDIRSFLGFYYKERQRRRTVVRRVEVSGNLKLGFIFLTNTSGLFFEKGKEASITTSGKPVFLIIPKEIKNTSTILKSRIKKYLESTGEDIALYVFKDKEDLQKIGSPSKILSLDDLPVVERKKRETGTGKYTGPVKDENRIISYRIYDPHKGILMGRDSKAVRDKDGANRIWITTPVNLNDQERLRKLAIFEDDYNSPRIRDIYPLFECVGYSSTNLQICITSSKRKEYLEKLGEKFLAQFLTEEKDLHTKIREYIDRKMKQGRLGYFSDSRVLEAVSEACGKESSEALNLMKQISVEIANVGISNSRSLDADLGKLKYIYKLITGGEYVASDVGESDAIQAFYTRYPMVGMLITEYYHMDTLRNSDNHKKIRQYIKERDAWFAANNQ